MGWLRASFLGFKWKPRKSTLCGFPLRARIPNLRGAACGFSSNQRTAPSADCPRKGAAAFVLQSLGVAQNKGPGWLCFKGPSYILRTPARSIPDFEPQPCGHDYACKGVVPMCPIFGPEKRIRVPRAWPGPAGRPQGLSGATGPVIGSGALGAQKTDPAL